MKGRLIHTCDLPNYVGVYYSDLLGEIHFFQRPRSCYGWQDVMGQWRLKKLKR